ncbi:MAG: hypothetical protein RMK18_03985 [Armatimonadota bacterium]|nr:hypothetical protein [Armatimonadota bacterium]MCX7777183.1 hypothetical protein [Armatimonadota bacterium]MDW8025010.1 hypothetical protein [Armatimonadota bacterium]
MLPIGISICELLKGCGGSPGSLQGEHPFNMEPDIMLMGDEVEMAEQLQDSYGRLKEIADDPDRQLRIGFDDGGQMEILTMHFCEPKKGVANYRHLRVVKESTGEAVRLVWGWDGIKPAIQFVDDYGRLLTINGTKMDFKITDASGRLPSRSVDWLSLGVKWIAVGFAIWLGAQVARLIVSAIAFLAFNAMVIGALMMAVGIIVPILELTGWTFEDVKSFIGRMVEELVNVLREGAEFMSQMLAQLAT